MPIGNGKLAPGRKAAILRFIHTSSREHGYPPTLLEIAEALAIPSKSLVHFYLNALVREGRLGRTARSPRSLVLSEKGLAEVRPAQETVA